MTVLDFYACSARIFAAKRPMTPVEFAFQLANKGAQTGLAAIEFTMAGTKLASSGWSFYWKHCATLCEVNLTLGTRWSAQIIDIKTRGPYRMQGHPAPETPPAIPLVG